MLNSKQGNYFTYKSYAFGYSGTGQINQLPYYDYIAREYRPHVVVLVIVGNDFSNNSSVLEALRNGWHPERQPRTTVREIEGSFVISNPDVDFQEYLIDSKLDNEKFCADKTPMATAMWIAHKKLQYISMFYNYMLLSIEKKYNFRFEDLIIDNKNRNIVNERLQYLRVEGDKITQTMLHDERELSMSELDTNFNKNQLTPLFSDALKKTDFSLSEWKRRANEDNFQLIALVTHSVSSKCKKESVYRDRFVELLEKNSIPYYDQCKTIVESGKNVEEARFRHEGHWSEQGHLWAAETLLPFFENFMIK